MAGTYYPERIRVAKPRVRDERPKALRTVTLGKDRKGKIH
jgi:hypothetical protein